MLIFPFPRNEALAKSLARKSKNAKLGKITIENFPDGETHINFGTKKENTQGK